MILTRQVEAVANFRKLSLLEGFRVLGERPYLGPQNVKLSLRILEPDGISDMELRFKNILHSINKITAQDAINKSLIPCCCEHCGGSNFVQKLVVQNKRVIEVLECAGGREIYTTTDRTRICTAQHHIVNGRVLGLTPSPEQIKASGQMVFREMLDRKRSEVESDSFDGSLCPQLDEDDEADYGE